MSDSNTLPPNLASKELFKLADNPSSSGMKMFGINLLEDVPVCADVRKITADSEWHHIGTASISIFFDPTVKLGRVVAKCEDSNETILDGVFDDYNWIRRESINVHFKIKTSSGVELFSFLFSESIHQYLFTSQWKTAVNLTELHNSK